LSQKRIFSEEETKKAIEWYKNGESLHFIRKQLKTKSDKIKKLLIKNNVDIKGRGKPRDLDSYKKSRKYFFNEEYFKKIDHQDKAYWLGFLYADGCVTVRKNSNGNQKGGCLEIGLKEEDDYHLYNFLYSISGDMPVKYKDVKLNEKIYKSCRVVINSISMVKDLINLGCVQKKSLILKFPTFLPDLMIRHFIRGYIDGDGCIEFYPEYKSSTFRISILGTESFLSSLKSNLELNNIKCGNVRCKKTNLYELYIHGVDNLEKLYSYLYDGSNIFLSRKIDKYRKGLLYKGKNFKNKENFKMSLYLDDEFCKMLKSKDKLHLLRSETAAMADLLD